MLAFSHSESGSVKAVSDYIQTKGRELNFTAVPVSGISKYSEDVIEGLRSGYLGTRVKMGGGMEAAKGGDGLLQGRHVYLRCPIEGGNMLTGSDFIIVGMDSL